MRRRRGKTSQGDRPAETIHPITSAPVPLVDDQQRRMRRYLIQMTIRVVCFIAAFVAWTVYPNPYLMIGLVGAAAVLPYFAVVGVNAGRESHATTYSVPSVTDPQRHLTSKTPREGEDLHDEQ